MEITNAEYLGYIA